MLKSGFAKRQFLQNFRKVPWNSKEIHSSRWPILSRFLEQKRITLIENYYIDLLFGKDPLIKEDVCLFVCHLLLAAKEGHVCIKVNDQKLYPNVLDLWKNEEEELSVEDAAQLERSIIQGSRAIPQEYISENSNTPLCKFNEFIYLQKHWMYESLFIQSFSEFVLSSPKFQFNLEKIVEQIEQLERRNLLLKEQGQAILNGFTHALSLVTGGPGTGKTYTAGYLIKIFWDQLSEDQKSTCEIILAAPTGKAAANLEKSFNKFLSNLDILPQIQTKTVHSLLGLKRNKQDLHQLTADLIIIDESSMLDIKMMAYLFQSLKPGSRLVLLGDKNQLPSIEAGSVFSDLVEGVFPKKFTCVELSTCLRTELKSLNEFSQKIKEGLGEEVIESLMDRSSCHDIKFHSLPEEQKKFQNELIQKAASHFLSFSPEFKPEEILSYFQTYRLLSPLRKGVFGFESLNQAIGEKILTHFPKEGIVAVPIMICVNDYRNELFNGETGVLIKHDPFHVTEKDFALFPGKKEGEVRRFSSLLLPRYEWAFCLSVHKSQGSEFDHIILAMPEGSEVFGKELLYTAATRARKSLEIVSTQEIILKIMSKKGSRLSAISERLR